MAEDRVNNLAMKGNQPNLSGRHSESNARFDWKYRETKGQLICRSASRTCLSDPSRGALQVYTLAAVGEKACVGNGSDMS